MTQRRATRRTFIVLLAASLSCGWPAAAQTPAQTPAPRPIVILGVPAEVRDVEAQLTRATIERVQGVPFSVGVIGSTRVVLGKTNAGKVNAAMMTTLAVNHYSPSAVFFTGTAGAVDPELKPGDVVLGTAIGYHDFGAATRRRVRAARDEQSRDWRRQPGVLYPRRAAGERGPSSCAGAEVHAGAGDDARARGARRASS